MSQFAKEEGELYDRLNVVSQSAQPDSQKALNNLCSDSGSYWNEHKLICMTLKELSNEIQPFHNAVKLVDDILESEHGNDTKVLKLLLAYAVYQFFTEEEVTGTEEIIMKNRDREDGQEISGWKIDIGIVHQIQSRIVANYVGSIPEFICDGLFPCLERSLYLLRSYYDGIADTDMANTNMANYLRQELFITEQLMASVALSSIRIINDDAAEGHCERCLIYAREFGIEGETKTTFMFEALLNLCTLREHQCDFSNAVKFVREAYNLVLANYGVVHPQVQQAVGILISCLIDNNDLFDAETLARSHFKNLKDSIDGIDQDGEEVAMVSYNLADVIQRQKGDLSDALLDEFMCFTYDM
jgi:hypothetical protein